MNLTCQSTDPRYPINHIEVGFGVADTTGLGGSTDAGSGWESPGQPSVSFNGPLFISGCLSPGTYRWRMGVDCQYTGPNGYGQDTIQDAFFSDPGGTFTLTAADQAVTLGPTLLSTPTPDANVKLSWSFGAANGNIRIGIDSINNLFTPALYTGTKNILLTPGHHTIYAMSCRWNNVVASATIDVPQAITYTLTGQVLDGSAVQIKQLPEGMTNAYAQVPLGLELQLGLKNGTNYVPATYTLTPIAPTNTASPTLYPHTTALEFNRTAAEQLKTFLGVHLGTQQLTITPTDPMLPPVIVTLGIIDPGALGDDSAFDTLIISWGNARGIPPHLLKGMIRKEGPFNPFEYRYEPLTTDRTTVENHLEDNEYEDYILANSDGDPKGTLLWDAFVGMSSYNPLLFDDVSPRQRFSLPRGPNNTPIPIRPSDECPACVSAREIFLANDHEAGARQNWSDPHIVGGGNWHDPAHLALLTFTAQTPEAASYGLMQLLWTTALDDGWSTTDGQKNPHFLFDTPLSPAFQTGSLAAGTYHFYQSYKNCTTPDWRTDPNFPSYDAYKAQIIAAYNWYNHGHGDHNRNYGIDAWNFSQQYLPSHAGTLIFP